MTTDSYSSRIKKIASTASVVEARITEYKDYLSEGETRTRMFLIDPLLVALGWDVLDPNQVEVEFRSDGGVPDYVLRTSSGPCMIVEAKALGERLNDHQMQLAQYMQPTSSLRVEVGVLTNGKEWRVYERETLSKPSKFKISDQHFALDMQEHLARSKFAVNVPAFDEWEVVCERPMAPIEGSDTDSTLDAEWIGLDRDTFDPTGLKPSRLRLYDGTVEEIGSWRELIVTIARRLVKDGKLVAAHCPIPTREGSATSIVNVEPKHHGRAQSGPYDWVDIGGGIWCWSSQKASGKLSRTRTLLTSCEVEVGAVHFQLKEDET